MYSTSPENRHNARFSTNYAIFEDITHVYIATTFRRSFKSLQTSWPFSWNPFALASHPPASQGLLRILGALVPVAQGEISLASQS